MPSEVIWVKYENGWLAETEHGYFFAHKMHNLWYIDYETGNGIGLVTDSHFGIDRPGGSGKIKFCPFELYRLPLLLP